MYLHLIAAMKNEFALTLFSGRHIKPRFQLNLLEVAVVFCMTVLTLGAADAGLCVVYKGLNYAQTGPSTVTPRSGNDFAEFRAFASMTSPGSLLSGSIRNPINQTFNLAADGQELAFGMDFNSQANMDAAFANGNYLMSLSTRNDGNRSFTLNLSGDAYPPIPQINNYSAVQTMDPTAPVTVQWAAWSGGAANDIVILEIEDSQTGDMVFSTPMPGMSGALNGTSTSVSIPANTFAPNRTYSGKLLFFHPVSMDMTSYPGATAVAGYLRSTSFGLATTGTPVDTQAPWLENQAPNYGDTGVPRNAGVSFQFSEPMQASVAIQWNPSLSFNYQWNAERTVLFCFPAGGLLPANTTISFTLNPPGQTGFRDVAGNALPTINGQFTTGAGTVSPDVRAYVIVKEAYYVQSSPTTVIAPTNDPPFAFGAFVEMSAPATVTNVTFGGPNDVTMEFDGNEWSGGVEASTQANMDAAFPQGTYTFTMQTVHDGLRQASLNLPATSLPNAPRLVNFNAAQAIDPQSPFTLQWEPFAGATTNDRIQIEIEFKNQWSWRTVFSSPHPLSPAAINGLTTSILIPAGTLPPGRQFTAFISFIKVASLNTNTYPGAMGVVAFAANTTVPIATIGQPSKPVLRNLRHFGSFVRFEIQGEQDTPYTIEFSEDLRQWYPLRSDWNHTGTLVIEDWNANPNRRFYRVREGW